MTTPAPQTDRALAPHTQRLARRLLLLALCVDLLFALVVVGSVIYVLPKEGPMLFGRWNYSTKYDNVVWFIGAALPVTAAMLRYHSSSLSGKRRTWRIIAILIVEMGVASSCCLPVRSHAREITNRVKCASNLRSIGQAIQRFVNERGGRLPRQFVELVVMDGVTASIFTCPSTVHEAARGDSPRALLADFAASGHCSYVYCGADLAAPVAAGCILAHDMADNHNLDGIHVLYGDGSVQWLPMDRAKQVLAELAAGHNPPRPAAATDKGLGVSSPLPGDEAVESGTGLE